MQTNKQSEKTGKTQILNIICILALTIMTAIAGIMIGRNLTHTRSAATPTDTPETSSPAPMQEPQSSLLPKVPTPHTRPTNMHTSMLVDMLTMGLLSLSTWLLVLAA